MSLSLQSHTTHTPLTHSEPQPAVTHTHHSHTVSLSLQSHTHTPLTHSEPQPAVTDTLTHLTTQLLPDSLDDLLLPASLEHVPEVYVVGTQETTGQLREWEVLVQQTLGPSHLLIQSVSLGELSLLLLLRRDLLWFCSGQLCDMYTTHSHTLTHKHTQMHIHTYTLTHSLSLSHTHTRTHTHTHTLTHTHTHYRGAVCSLLHQAREFDQDKGSNWSQFLSVWQYISLHLLSLHWYWENCNRK